MSNIPKKCLACNSQDELELKIVEYEHFKKFWMCAPCIKTPGQFDKAKARYEDINNNE